MKILIVGNRKHQLIRSLVYEVREYYKLANNKVVIDILSQEVEKVIKVDSLFDNVFNLNLPKFICFFRPLRGFFEQLLFRRRIQKIINNYEVVHIHYVEDLILRDIDFFLKNIKEKLIVSVWGSDFFRATKEKRKKLLKLLNYATTITISNSEAEKSIRDYYKEKLLNVNINVCYFIIKPLYTLKEVKEKYTPKESCSVLGFNNNRIIITIGYNASEMQQHLKILEILEKDEKFKQLSNKIKIVLPVTYPKNKVYINKLQEVSKKSSYQIELLTEFMTNEEVAHLRNATNIMIQLQTTDMLSASMLEHLYAENKVITGSWLPYQEIKDMDLSFDSIDNLESLPLKLVKSINDYQNNDVNAKIIDKYFGKNKLIKNWIDIYNIDEKLI